MAKFKREIILSNATLDAFGETKTVDEWSRDARCSVSANLLIDRLRRGFPAERAITSPPAYQVPVPKALSKYKYTPKGSSLGRTRGGTAQSRIFEAFGEQKTLWEWVEDARCVVALPTLNARLAAGWPVEQALTTRPYGRSQYTFDLTAYGETMTTRQWAADPRAAVGAEVIAARIYLGWTPEDAISTPPKPADQG